MSYDVGFVLGLDGEDHRVGDTRNYTSNCAWMWREAGCDIAAFNGLLVTDFIPALSAAIVEMRLNIEHYRAGNPDNGWGDADGVLEKFLEPLLLIARTVHPDARVWVYR